MLSEPFHVLPPDGPLPTLPRHATYAFKPARPSSPGCAQVAHLPQAQDVEVEQQRQVQDMQAPRAARIGGASAALDEYIAGGRAPPKQQRTGDVRYVDNADSAERADSSSAAQLPGTRMPLRGAEAARVDRHQLADIAWQPSKFELEAELGACRERQRELEWRVAAAEAALREQSRRPAGAWRATDSRTPLALGAADGIGCDGRPQAHTRPGKAEIDALIERYEDKRRAWRTPAWAHSGSGRADSPLLPGDEDEMLGQLGAFQVQTEAIRRQLARTGAILDGDDGPLGSPLSVCQSPVGSGGCGGLGEQLSDMLEHGGRTPMYQQPIGFRGDGVTPASGLRSGSLMPTSSLHAPSLFDGLPPSPLGPMPSATAYNRHIAHVGHHLGSDSQQQQPAVEQPAVDQQRQHQQHQQPVRSPIGPEVRHTLKSAAAAQKVGSAQKQAGSALMRLKQRQAATVASQAAQHSAEQQQQPPSIRRSSQQHTEEPKEQNVLLDRASEEQPPACEQRQQQRGLRPSPLLQLPLDSNAALAADVRELKARLLSTLREQDAQPEAMLGSGSALASMREASPPPPASHFRLTDYASLELGRGGGGAGRLTDASSSPRRLTDTTAGGIGGSSSSLGGRAGLGSGDLEESDGGGKEFSLEAFERETELLRQQISAWRPAP